MDASMHITRTRDVPSLGDVTTNRKHYPENFQTVDEYQRSLIAA